MAYTPPVATAVDFAVETGYTPPAATAVDFAIGAGGEITLAASGGLSIGGSAALSTQIQLAATGGIVLGGASALSTQIQLSAAGGLALAGASALSTQIQLAAAGGVVIGGTARLYEPPEMEAAGGFAWGGAAALSTQIQLAAVGGLAIAGASALSTQIQLAAAGGLALAGAAMLRTSLPQPAPPPIFRSTRPLSDSMPLRTTAAWGSYKDLRVIPYAYGRVTLTPVQYDQAGRVWVLADHPIAGVDRVTRDEVETTAYAWRNGLDSTDHPVAFLELAEPLLAEGESLAVTLRGRQNAATGALIVSPADVLVDLLATFAGRPIAAADVDDFRAASSTRGIEIGGLVDSADRTIRSYVVEAMDAVGALVSLAMPGIARYIDDAETPLDSLSPLDINQPSAEARHDRLVSVLRVLYDYDYAAGGHRRAIQLEAPAAIERFGRLESELDARWLRRPRDAEAVGRALLSRQARPIWAMSWTASLGWRNLHVGQDVALLHPLLPATTARINDVALDLSTGRIGIDAEAPAGPAPAIEITQLSTAYEPLIGSGPTVSYADGVATFTIYDEQGLPLQGAEATLDGTTTRTTDAGGRVQFTTPRGLHLLHVEATGYVPLDFDVTL